LATRDNSKVYKVPVEHPNNTFGYTFFVHCNDEGKEMPICYFGHTWNTIKWSVRRREFYLGELFNKISIWNTTPDPSVTAFADLPLIDVTNVPPQEERNDSLHSNSDYEETPAEKASEPSTPESDSTIRNNI
jgi:hypothetical protein